MKYAKIIKRSIQYSSLVLALVALVLSGVACQDSLFKEESTATFSFVAPEVTTIAVTEPPTVATTPALETFSEPTEREATTATTDIPGPNGTTTSEEPVAAEVNWVNLASDPEQNQEPSVPMSVPADNPIRGVSGTKAERFFRTLSTEPVTYHYLLLPGEASGLEDGEEITQPLEISLALSEGKSYLRTTDKVNDWIFLQLNASNYYQINMMDNTYTVLPGLSTQQNELSMDAFARIEDNAANFIDTGRGNAVFCGMPVRFEEFTVDGLTYVRYYFRGDVLVGHRRFADGRIVQTVVVHEASNRYDPELFNLPDGLRQETASTAPQG